MNIRVGPLGLLGVIIIILKLTEVINWSWWWVLSPIWGGFGLLGVITAILLCLQENK